MVPIACVLNLCQCVSSSFARIAFGRHFSLIFLGCFVFHCFPPILLLPARSCMEVKQKHSPKINLPRVCFFRWARNPCQGDDCFTFPFSSPSATKKVYEFIKADTVVQGIGNIKGRGELWATKLTNKKRTERYTLSSTFTG